MIIVNHNVVYISQGLRGFVILSVILQNNQLATLYVSMRQSDLGLYCPHMPEDMFSHSTAHLSFYILQFVTRK